MTKDGKRWWRFFGDLFALSADYGEAMPVVTANVYYRRYIINMIAPTEFMPQFVRLCQPANDNDGAWWLS